MNIKKTALFSLALFALPAFALAQDLSGLDRLLNAIGDLVDSATPIVVGIALLAFFWGLARYIFNAGSDEAKKEGRNIMIWGIVALFVMVSVWGLVRFLGDALDIDQVDSINPPGVQGL